MIFSITLVIIAYLIGSISSAIIVCKTCSLPDPRLEGSKNPGATNVLRLAGKKYAVLVMAADLLKGLIPVVLAKLLGAGPITLGFIVLAAAVGHMFPLFFQFRGGKGVATTLGGLVGLNIILGTLVIATWLLVARFSQYSSLASLVSIILAPLYSLLILQNTVLFLPLFILAILITYKHRNNITRIMDGDEPKIKIKPNIINDLQKIMEEDSTTVSQPEPSSEIKQEKKPVVRAKKPTAATNKSKPIEKKETVTEKKVKKTKPAAPINKSKKAKKP